MSRSIRVVTLVVALSALGSALGRPGPEGPAAALQLVPPDAAAFLHVRIAELWDSPLGKQVRAAVDKDDPKALAELDKAFGIPIANLTTMTVVLPKLDGPQTGLIVIFTTKAPFSKEAVLKAFEATGPQANTAGLDMHRIKNDLLTVLTDRTIVAMSGLPVEEAVAAAKRMQATPGRTGQPGGLGPAMDRAAGKAIAAGVTGKLFEVFPPTAPFDVMLPLRKVQVMSLGFDIRGPEAALGLWFSFPADAAAAEGEKAVRAGLKMLTDLSARIAVSPPPPGPAGVLFKRVVQDGQTSLGKAEVKRDRTAAIVSVSMTIAARAARGTEVATALVSYVRWMREQAKTENLKMIVLGMHNYHDMLGSFPGNAIYSPDGKTALLSWRVAILPYLGEAELYKQFKLDEPWDSEHNKKLIPRMPKVYLARNAPPAKEPGQSHYRVFVGAGAVFDRGPKGVRFVDITDGTANTLMIVEAAESVPWTKPDELDFDPKKPLPKLGADPTAETFLAAFCDGSVHFIRKTVAEATLKALITRAGGEPVNPEELDK
jgi:hypothetical protein